MSSVSSQLYSGFIPPTFPWEKMFLMFGGLFIVGITAATAISIVKEKKEVK